MVDGLDVAKRAGATRVRFRARDTIFRPGDEPKGWIVVERGFVRVGLTADNGREVLLYRIAAGDSCLLTTSALMTEEPIVAEAVAETDVEAWFLPRAEFERRLGQDADFRREVLRNYADRVAELVLVIQDTLFHALPARLARLVLSRALDGAVEATHQDLAGELGSVREVVTRVLRRFEKEALIRVERGRISICDALRLESLARASGDLVTDTGPIRP